MKDNKLPGDYIAGFVDGEGCFALKFSKETKRNRPGSPAYYRWGAEFVIYLKKDDVDILMLIRQTLKTGTVRVTRKYARYSVQNTEDLCKIIIPFFKKYKLRAKKTVDFELWAEAVNIIYKNIVGNTATKGIKGFIKKQWDKKDLDKLINIRKEMLKIKASRSNDFRHGANSLNNFSYS